MRDLPQTSKYVKMAPFLLDFSDQNLEYIHNLALYFSNVPPNSITSNFKNYPKSDYFSLCPLSHFPLSHLHAFAWTITTTFQSVSLLALLLPVI